MRNLLICLLFCLNGTNAGVLPAKFCWQGFYSAANGLPSADTVCSATFTIADQQGQIVFTQVEVLPINTGIIATTIGKTGNLSIPAKSCFLSVQINGRQIGDKTLLPSAPYCLFTDTAEFAFACPNALDSIAKKIDRTKADSILLADSCYGRSQGAPRASVKAWPSGASIGTDTVRSSLNVVGDVEIVDSSAALVLRSSNGKRYRIRPSASGAITSSLKKTDITPILMLLLFD